MRLCYFVLSPTFGMYQVAADLANRFASMHNVHALTAQHAPLDRFAPTVEVHQVAKSSNSGMELASLDVLTLHRLMRKIRYIKPEIAHFAAPHIWNLPVILSLRSSNVPVVYTLHDLDPHHGTRFSALMRLFNKLIVHLADHLFVYGEVYKKRLVSAGLSQNSITVIPLLHLFLSYEEEMRLGRQKGAVTYEPFALFFGRLEAYKGLDVLLRAFEKLQNSGVRLVIAGPGSIEPYLPRGRVNENVELRNMHVDDQTARELFSRCGLVVLPYVDATQSALISSAYFFRKPVVVSRSGALPEYVEDGQTGYIVEPGDAESLAVHMRDLLANPGRLCEMGAAGYEWYQHNRQREYQILQDVYSALSGGS